MSISLLVGRLKDMPKWQLIERAAAILEQTLSPEAKVEHHRYLKNTRTGRRRECDIVIRSGTSEAPVLTIGEVQDRSVKVDSRTYESWLKKRERLGADR